MAEVSYLQLHLNDDNDHEDGYDDRDDFVNWSHDLHSFEFDSYSHDFFPNYSDQNHLINRENQVNFVIDMFHQRIEQLNASIETDDSRINPDNNRSFHEGLDMNNLVVEFELGFHVAGETEIDESNLQMIFESEPDNDSYDLPGIHPNSYDTSELDQDQPDPLSWEILLNVHNFETNPDLATGQFDENNFTDEYEMLFGQFVDNIASSSSGQPPASTTAVENLLSVVITDEDVEKNDTHCAVCKDEIRTGILAKQLPCLHRYHSDCIVKWLGFHNTCPLCRHELLTDDPDYERKKADRAARDY